MHGTKSSKSRRKLVRRKQSVTKGLTRKTKTTKRKTTMMKPRKDILKTT